MDTVGNRESGLKERLQQFLQLPERYAESNLKQQRQAALLNYLTLASIGIGIVAPLALLVVDLLDSGLIGVATIRFTIAMAILILMAVISNILLKRGAFEPASWLILGTCWTISTVLAISSGGIRDVSLVASLLILVLAAFILGRKQALLFGALGVFTVAGLFFLERGRILTIQVPESASFYDLFGWVVFLILAVVLLNHIVVAYEQTTQEDQEKSQILEELEGKLQHSLQELEALSQASEFDQSMVHLHQVLTRDASAVPDLQGFMISAVEMIADQLGYYHVGIYTIDESQDFAVLQAASSEGGKRLISEGHKLAVGKAGLVGFTTGTGKPRIAEDVDADPIYTANPALPFTQSELVIPLVVQEKIMGALDVQSDQLRGVDPQIVNALTALADMIALTIFQHMLQAEVSSLQTENGMILEAVKEFAASRSHDSILTKSTSLVRRAFGAMRVTLGVLEGDYVVVRSCSTAQDVPAIPAGGVQAAKQSVLGQAIIKDEPISFNGPLLGGDLTLVGTDPGQDVHTYAIPLRGKTGTIGAIAMEYDPAAMDQSIRHATEVFASLIGLTLENAQLQQELDEYRIQLDEIQRSRVHEDWMDFLGGRAERGALRTVEFQSPTLPADEVAQSSQYETPIELRGETIGKLAIQGVQQSDWTEEDLTILQSVADEVAGTLEQMRLMEELERRATQLQIASEVARDATGQLDESTLLRGAVDLIRERFDLYHVSVLLLDESGTNANVRESSGEAEAEIRQSKEFVEVGSHSIVGRVTQLGESYVAHDVTKDRYYQAHPLLPHTRTEFVVPLKIGERVIGALDFQGNEAFAFSDDEMAVFEILADQLAVAIQNARLFEGARAQAEREKAVTDIGGKIRASGDIDTILQTTVLELQNALGARRARISLKPFGAEPEPLREAPAVEPGGIVESHASNLIHADEGQEFE